MQYPEFLSRVKMRTKLSDDDEADRTIRAVLWTLSERIGPKESADTAAQLPKELKGAFAPGPAAEPFDAHEFVRRVSERLDLGEDEARERIRAVMLTLEEAVQPGELEDWQSALSLDYVDLAARPADIGGPPRTGIRGPRRPADAPIGEHDFTRRVAARIGVDEQRARRTIEAVLETFGERIARGEAEDLAALLPDSLAQALLRKSAGNPEPMGLDEFIRRVAEREGEPPALAREHTRAVLTTLREATTLKEWQDAEAELPKEYVSLLA
jgi:uncharacterized protein (DUF2267 family)